MKNKLLIVLLFFSTIILGQGTPNDNVGGASKEQNLQEVLTVGNNGGQLDYTNVNKGTLDSLVALLLADIQGEIKLNYALNSTNNTVGEFTDNRISEVMPNGLLTGIKMLKNSGTNDITLSGFGGQTVDGSTYNLVAGEGAIFQFDETSNWVVVASTSPGGGSGVTFTSIDILSDTTTLIPSSGDLIWVESLGGNYQYSTFWEQYGELNGREAGNPSAVTPAGVWGANVSTTIEATWSGDLDVVNPAVDYPAGTIVTWFLTSTANGSDINFVAATKIKSLLNAPPDELFDIPNTASVYMEFEVQANGDLVEIYRSYVNERQTLVYFATITPNVAIGEQMQLSLTGDVTIDPPIGAVASDVLTFIITADGTDRNVTFSGTSYKDFDGVTNIVDVIPANETRTYIFNQNATLYVRTQETHITEVRTFTVYPGNQSWSGNATGLAKTDSINYFYASPELDGFTLSEVHYRALVTGTGSGTVDLQLNISGGISANTANNTWAVGDTQKTSNVSNTMTGDEVFMVQYAIDHTMTTLPKGLEVTLIFEK